MAKSQVVDLDELDGGDNVEVEAASVNNSDVNRGFDNTQTDLQTVNSQPPVLENNAPNGGYHFTKKVEFDSDDLNMTYLNLAQALSPAVAEGRARPGDWLASGYDPMRDIVVIPFGYAKKRILYVDEERLCHSDDAIFGQGKPGGSCKQCPMAQWLNTPDGKRSAPQCTLKYHYMVFSVSHNTIAEIQFKSTQIPAAKFINGMIQTKGLGEFAIKLSAQQEKNARGQPYQVPVPTLENNFENSESYFEQVAELMSLGG